MHIVAGSEARRTMDMIDGAGLSRTDQHGRPRRQARDADTYIGGRIRERRIMLGLSQQALAEVIGVTYQQLRKYEIGVNRVSAGPLYQIARTLRVGIGYFFEGLASGSALKPSPQQRMLLELARTFAGIADPRQREALCELARVLAAEPANGDSERAA